MSRCGGVSAHFNFADGIIWHRGRMPMLLTAFLINLLLPRQDEGNHRDLKVEEIAMDALGGWRCPAAVSAKVCNLVLIPLMTDLIQVFNPIIFCPWSLS